MQKKSFVQTIWKSARTFFFYGFIIAVLSFVGIRLLENNLLLPRACGGGLIQSFGDLFRQVKYEDRVEDLPYAKCQFSYPDDMQIVYRRLSAERFKTIRLKIKNFDVEPAKSTDGRFQRKFAETPNWWAFDSSRQYLISRASPFDSFLEGLKFLIEQKPIYIVDITNPKFVDVYAYIKWR